MTFVCGPEELPEHRHPTSCGEQTQDNHIDKPRQVLQLVVIAVVRLKKSQGQLLQERSQNVNSEGLSQESVVAERVQGLNEMFGQPEVLLLRDPLRPFEYVRHLQDDGFY